MLRIPRSNLYFVGVEYLFADGYPNTVHIRAIAVSSKHFVSRASTKRFRNGGAVGRVQRVHTQDSPEFHTPRTESKGGQFQTLEYTIQIDIQAARDL